MADDTTNVHQRVFENVFHISVGLSALLLVVSTMLLRAPKPTTSIVRFKRKRGGDVALAEDGWSQLQRRWNEFRLFDSARFNVEEDEHGRLKKWERTDFVAHAVAVVLGIWLSIFLNVSPYFR